MLLNIQYVYYKSDVVFNFLGSKQEWNNMIKAGDIHTILKETPTTNHLDIIKHAKNANSLENNPYPENMAENNVWEIYFKVAQAPPNHLVKQTQAEQGKVKAAIKLQCLDCTNWQPVEIRNCNITGCPPSSSI